VFVENPDFTLGIMEPARLVLRKEPTVSSEKDSLLILVENLTRLLRNSTVFLYYSINLIKMNAGK
jgi:hypothetical protein